MRSRRGIGCRDALRQGDGGRHRLVRRDGDALIGVATARRCPHLRSMVKRTARPTLNRSQIMSRIRGSDTGPERMFRRALRARGIGYRLHARDLPGRPDVVFRGARTVVFVHGCFWHRHPGCRRATTPGSSTEFWNAKFRANVRRDRNVIERLSRAGWQVGVVWECEVSRPDDLSLAVDAVAQMIGR